MATLTLGCEPDNPVIFLNKQPRWVVSSIGQTGIDVITRNRKSVMAALKEVFSIRR